MTTLEAGRLVRLATSALTRAGVSEADAATVAECLVASDMGGQASHGVVRLPLLVRRLRARLINPGPEMRVTSPRPAVALLDADNALGPVAGLRAVELAVERAQAFGVGVAIVRRSNHLGALGFYTRRIAARGMLGLCFSNTPPAMAPPGAGRPLLGTNPIAAGFPRAGGTPVVVDLATSQVARGRILQAREKGEAIPAGWALGRDGRPATDPAAGLDGTLAPLGGGKGFALALMVEALTGVLAGAGVGPEVSGTFTDSDRPSDVGHSFWALDVEVRGGDGGFAERMALLASEVSAAGGRVPGERHRGAYELALGRGVDVPEALVVQLEALAGEVPGG